jgi:hypothetical protein
MRILIISENMDYSSMIKDVIYSLKPGEIVEVARLNEGISISLLFEPNIILFDFDLLGHGHEQFIQKLRIRLPLASIIIIGLPPVSDLYAGNISTCESGRWACKKDIFQKLAPIFSRCLT